MASFSTPSEAYLPWSNPRVCVLGDVMVDAYMWGSVSRMSPEAPVPVVEVTQREQRVGGAGNVVKNLHALGATVDVIAVVGEDEAGRMLHGLLATMAKPALLTDPSRRTTVKTRIISDGQHVVRVDEETTDSIDEAMQSLARNSLLTLLQGNDKPDVVVLEDYDKGFFSQGLIQAIIADCHTHDVPVVVDPKLKHFLDFTGVDLFKPNLKELNEGLGLPHSVSPLDAPAMAAAVESLMAQLRCDRLMVTMGEHGVWMHAPSEGVNHAVIPAFPRDVADVSGAGDTVIAVAALMLASGSKPKDLATVANLAGGWVCERVGVVPVTREALESELQRLKLQHTVTR